jgi:hypothetical protein
MKTKKPKETMRDEALAFAMSAKNAVESGEIKCFHLAMLDEEGILRGTYGGGTYQELIGMLEIAKHKFLEERREDVLKRVGIPAPKKRGKK